MGKNSDEIVVGANGSIWTAPLGSPLPASIAEPFGDAWVDLGYASEDGVTWTDSKSLNSIRVWQEFYDARRVIESREGTLAFSLMQWNGETVSIAFGGGDITEDEPGQYRYTPPAPELIDERMLGVEWEDGDKDYRLVYPKGMTTDDVEVNIVRTDAGMLPITFGLLGNNGADPWFFQTNDPAFASAVVGSGS